MSPRYTIVTHEPVPGPVRFHRAEVIQDPTVYIRSTLLALDLALEVQSRGLRRSWLPMLLQEYVARLAACGCVVTIPQDREEETA